jgi:hypothetical protein
MRQDLTRNNFRKSGGFLSPFLKRIPAHSYIPGFFSFCMTPLRRLTLAPFFAGENASTIANASNKQPPSYPQRLFRASFSRCARSPNTTAYPHRHRRILGENDFLPARDKISVNRHRRPIRAHRRSKRS